MRKSKTHVCRVELGRRWNIAEDVEALLVNDLGTLGHSACRHSVSQCRADGDKGYGRKHCEGWLTCLAVAHKKKSGLRVKEVVAAGTTTEPLFVLPAGGTFH